MDKDKFLTTLAEHGYNVQFGARKHFATYDIIEKIPGRIAFLTLCIGIWQIYKPDFNFNKEVSLLIIFASIAALLINQYTNQKDDYRKTANRLIEIHNALKEMYYKIQSSSTPTVDQIHQDKLQELLREYYRISISKQIFFSDWYAHYKFFYQCQYEWINEQKNFTWKDKIPLSARLVVALILITIVIASIYLFMK